jgi:ferredoxin-NADP reductase
VRSLTDAAYSIRCERAGLEFAAGQCANLGFPGAGVNREYSTYSGEQDEDLEFLIREVPGGLVSSQLRSLKAGEHVEIHGFYGDFQLQERHDGRPYVFIATGTGIAPFRSFVRSSPGLDYQIVHGIRFASERYDCDDYTPDRYTSCVSRESGGDFKGRVTDFLRGHTVDRDAVCYLCGNRAMISEAYGLLRAQGIDSDNIYSECFF